MPLCQCGCGEKTKGKKSKFKPGHCKRGGVTQSDETKRKISATLTGVKVPSRGKPGAENSNAGNTPELFNPAWLANEAKTKSGSRIARELGIPRPTLYSALKRYGIRITKSDAGKAAYREFFPDDRRGADGPNWKGGRLLKRHYDGAEYYVVRAPEHPNNRNGYVLEHRLVMEEELGRYLREDEVVHHINGDKLDNRPENLEVHTRRSHMKAHIEVDAENHRLKAELARYKAKFGDIEE